VLKYKGYTGHAKYDDEAGLFHGEALDLGDVITFEGASVEEVEQAFSDSIDDYLEFCEQT
jgi:predicted HicB family RNase H-like nuclease